jgi:hypothetical protein
VRRDNRIQLLHAERIEPLNDRRSTTSAIDEETVASDGNQLGIALAHVEEDDLET